jgi:hypothetical protein
MYNKKTTKVLCYMKGINFIGRGPGVSRVQSIHDKETAATEIKEYLL